MNFQVLSTQQGGKILAAEEYRPRSRQTFILAFERYKCWIIVKCSRYSPALHRVTADDSHPNVTLRYHRGELARSNLALGEMEKDEMEKGESRHRCLDTILI